MHAQIRDAQDPQNGRRIVSVVINHAVRDPAKVRRHRVLGPRLNEEISVGKFIEWCKEGLERAGVTGQILIIDSSTDKTPEIVLEHGGEVLRTPRRGLGRAYIDGLDYVRGKYVIMGDCDCTYDFREIGPFIEHFHKGSEFIMGSRFKGYIEAGAMPALHRYFGNPVLSFVGRLFFRCNINDFHCGLRAFRTETARALDLRTTGMEFASELVVKSALAKKRTEVGIRFRNDNQSGAAWVGDFGSPHSILKGHARKNQPPKTSLVHSLAGRMAKPPRLFHFQAGLFSQEARLLLFVPWLRSSLRAWIRTCLLR